MGHLCRQPANQIDSRHRRRSAATLSSNQCLKPRLRAEGKRISADDREAATRRTAVRLAERGPASKLNRALKSIVTVQSTIPEDAFTAQALGEQRSGSGIVIRESGLVLTIGYLITEAENVWLADADGRVTPAHALAIDAETGFGLVQALGDLKCPALELGRSSEAKLGDP